MLVVGGSHRYPGAILLAGRAAARSGAGVVTIAAGRSIVEMVAGQDPNLTFFPLAEVQPGLIATGAAAQLSTLLSDKIRALLVGPGLAHAAGTDEFVVAVLRNAKGATTVVDADGLNALARTEDWPSVLPPRTILTPHDGEAARLSGRVVPKDTARVAFAERQAAQWNVTLVLKGAVTVVTDGKRTYVHDAPNPTLSIGGSGDALGGAVAAFAARGLAPLAAAAAAVWVHGRAGALLAARSRRTSSTPCPARSARSSPARASGRRSRARVRRRSPSGCAWCARRDVRRGVRDEPARADPLDRRRRRSRRDRVELRVAACARDEARRRLDEVSARPPLEGLGPEGLLRRSPRSWSISFWLASGAFTTMRQLGGAFGVAILAAVFGLAGSYSSAASFSDGFSPATAVAGGLALAGALAGLALPGRHIQAGPAPAGEALTPQQAKASR